MGTNCSRAISYPFAGTSMDGRFGHQHQRRGNGQSNAVMVDYGGNELLLTTELAKTLAKKNVAPVGLPRKPSASSIPSQIAFSKKVVNRQCELLLDSSCTKRSYSTCSFYSTDSASTMSDSGSSVGGSPRLSPVGVAGRGSRAYSFSNRSGSFSSLYSSSDEYVSCTVDIFPDGDEETLFSPLSLLELCLRTLCHYTCDWIGPDGIPRINLKQLPPEIAFNLFEMLRTHRLLREDLLPAFHRCEIENVNLSQYPALTDSWIPDLTSLHRLRSLKLSHCPGITDDGFRSVAVLGYGKGQLEVLEVESCVNITDNSAAFVVHALNGSLLELNFSGCTRLTDATLSRVITATKLKRLSLNRCQLMTPLYLTQIGLLTDLEYLDLTLIPNVGHLVLSAFVPTRRFGAPHIVHAINRHLNHPSSPLGVDGDIESYDLIQDDGDLEAWDLGVSDSGANENHGFSVHIDGSNNVTVGYSSSYIAQRHRPLATLQIGNQENVAPNTSASPKSMSRRVLPRLRKQSRNRSKYLSSISPSSKRRGSAKGDPGFPRMFSETISVQHHLSTVKRKTGLGNLKEMRLGFCNVDDDGCQYLCKLKRLARLELTQNPVSARAVQQIVKDLHKLEQLNLDFCLVGNCAVDLFSLPNLEEYSLRHSNLTRLAIGQDHCHSDGGDESDEESARFTPLRSLDLSKADLDDQSFRLLPTTPKLKHLQVLKLQGVRIGTTAIEYISKLTGLTELDLSDTMVSDSAMQYLANLTELTNLNLFQCAISETGLRIAAPKLTKLEVLNLDCIDTNDACLKHLSYMPNLRALDLFGAKITDKGAALLSKCKLDHLEKLSICSGYITDLGVGHICKLKTLTHVNLGQNSQITDNGVKQLAQTFGMTMKSLCLSNTNITKHSITLFYSFIVMERLVVRDCKLNQTLVKNLQDSLPNLWFVLS